MQEVSGSIPLTSTSLVGTQFKHDEGIHVPFV